MLGNVNEQLIINQSDFITVYFTCVFRKIKGICMHYLQIFCSGLFGYVLLSSFGRFTLSFQLYVKTQASEK